MQCRYFVAVDSMLKILIATSSYLKSDDSFGNALVDEFVKHCKQIALNGSPRAAKLSVRCIAKLLRQEDMQSTLLHIFKVYFWSAVISQEQIQTCNQTG